MPTGLEKTLLSENNVVITGVDDLIKISDLLETIKIFTLSGLQEHELYDDNDLPVSPKYSTDLLFVGQNKKLESSRSLMYRSVLSATFLLSSLKLFQIIEIN